MVECLSSRYKLQGSVPSTSKNTKIKEDITAGQSHLGRVFLEKTRWSRKRTQEAPIWKGKSEDNVSGRRDDQTYGTKDKRMGTLERKG
jgi:hypothetical protein